MKPAKLAIFATLLTMASTTFAATSATNSSTIAPTLKVTATVQKAVSLTLLTGTAAGVPSHCTVVATGSSPDFTMDFGTVDALGIANGNCNKFAPATPGTTNAIYWTDYQLVPVYTSQSAFSGTTITAQVTSNFANSNVLVVRDTLNSNTVPVGVGSFSAMGTASADTIASGSAAIPGTGTPLTRFLGVAVTPANGAGLAVAQNATITFTLTVQ